MERRTGFAVAGAVAMILVAGAIAAGANMGLLGLGKSHTQVGKLRPTDAAGVSSADQTPQVITVEVQDPAGSATARVVTGSGSSNDQPVQVVDVPIPSGQRAVSGEHESESGDDGHESDD